jgi:hypothetical protein
MSESVPLPDLFDEAKRLVDGARAQGVTLRLLGGLAARFHCQALLFCLRDYSDIDVMGLGRQRTQIERVFVALGYEPHRMFNALHGDKRLEFRDPSSDRHVDVFLDRFEMEHTLDLRQRLEIEPYTISLGDLLLTKLTITRLNAKDVRDILTLLKDLPLGEQDTAGALNFGYMAATCAKDWGLYHTVMTNISHMGQYIDDYPLDADEKKAVLARIARLQREIESAPKSWRWKVRSLVGERVPWHQVVERQG